jgi:hypothetical protein
MFTDRTLQSLRLRGFTVQEILLIERLANDASRHAAAARDPSRRRLDTEAVIHAAAGGDPLAAKLAPLLRECHDIRVDGALLRASIALGERLRADML